METSFSVNSVELKNAFRKLFTVQKRKNSTFITIIVDHDNIELGIPGITQRIKAKGTVRADITMPATILLGFIQTSSSAIATFRFKKGELHFGSSVYQNSSIEVKESPVNRKEDIPINLNPVSILRFTSGKSKEDIEMLGLTSKVQSAKRKMNEAIEEAAEVLANYDICSEDLRLLIAQKLRR